MSRVLESVSLLILLVVVGLRPLIGEYYDSAGSPFVTPGVALIDPSPLRTLLIDMVILLAAVGWLLSRAIGARWKYRWCGIEPGAVVLAVGAVVSCVFAGNKRLALNATIDWLTLLVLTVVLAQLLRRPWQVRLTLCVILAGAAAQAAECFNQKFYSFAETACNYYEHRDEIWGPQGIPLDSSQVEMFERRLTAREATGFLWHSNIAGAYLVLTAFAGIGLALGKWCGPPVRFRRGLGALTGVLALALLAATGLTRSLGAFAAAGIGTTLAITFHLGRKWIASKRRLALKIGWACAVVGGAAAVGYGLYHGSLPGSSLNFRWQYWTASAKLIDDHRLSGVGMENFGRHYLQYKSITSPEEIKNPHNFLVSAACDWGVIGLAGVIVMLIGGSIVLARPSPHDGSRTAKADATACDDKDLITPGRPMVWMVLLGIGIFAPRVFLLGSHDFYYRVWMTVFPLLFWLPTFVLTSLESDTWLRFRDDPFPRLPLLLNCGLVAFLLSDLVNFALLVPAAVTSFFALLGVAMAVRSKPEPANDVSTAGRWIPAAGGIAVLILVATVFVKPVAQAALKLAQARAPIGVAPDRSLTEQPTYRGYLQAARADPLDPTPLAECARYAVAYAEYAGGIKGAVTEAVRLLDRAIERDPNSIKLHRDKRTYLTLLAEVTGEPDDYRRAADAAAGVLTLYPTSPDDHDALGDCYVAFGAVTDPPAPADVSTAIKAFEQALHLDASRPDWEIIRRFRSEKRTEIEQKIESLKQSVRQRPQ